MRLPARERRSQLLDVALEVFGEHGYHGASMNQVAIAAGVTKPVLYQHFRSKRELYRELLDDVGHRLETVIIEATTGAPSRRAQVTSGITSYFRFVADEGQAFQLLFAGETRLDEEFSATVRRVENTIADAVAELIEIPGLDDRARRLLAHGIVGLAEGTGRYWLESGMPTPPDEQAAQVSDLVWTGVRGLTRS